MLCGVVVYTGSLDSIEERVDRKLSRASLLLGHTLSPLTRDVTTVPCESYIERRTTFGGTRTWGPVNVSERTLGSMGHENVYSCDLVDHQ
jgi:hypothetical protein